MRPNRALPCGGVLLFTLGLLATPALAESPSTLDPQAAPSRLPASQADTQAISGQMAPGNTMETGTQQAAPSSKPANEATPGTVDAPLEQTNAPKL